MRESMLRMYHRLPGPARSAAATLQGLVLRRRRHGRDSEHLIEETLERDHWSADRWRAWTEERLAFVLHRAATRVPWYRDHWERRRRIGDRTSWEYLENWPVLERDEVRAAPRRFVADDQDIGKLFHEQTSGTTGKPLDVWRSRRTIELLASLGVARARRWHGIPSGVRWARLGGQLVIPTRQRKPPFWVWNGAMRQLYMSTYHLAPDLIPSYLDALARHKVRYLAGYTSALVALAQEALRLGRTDLKMLAAFTSAEPLLPGQRAVIAEAFGCPVLDSYGMTEDVAHASRCLGDSLHLWPEVGYIEVRGDEGAGVAGGVGAVAAGEAGELICTSLLNADMPLIRYRVGDRGALAPGGGACSCGRSLPVMSSIEGRSSDVLFTRDGRQVYWLSPVLYGLPVRQSQMVQESLDHITVRVAPGLGFTADTGRTIVARLKERLGPVSVQLLVVPEVPRPESGRARAVVCRLSSDERSAVLRRSRGAMEVAS